MELDCQPGFDVTSGVYAKEKISKEKDREEIINDTRDG